ncbi:hypothetical protein CRG98_013204 [Punica granatum]|uniref:RNase H type-1 domain-containing protein n=1 Tax=Punica granatum TaxID=22663 RepID=A0A2I0KCZ3_PUNGR|nr:hypothetical protein CRG98_013204 [Punica granatum]
MDQIAKSKKFRMQHTYREGNYCANKHANMALGVKKGLGWQIQSGFRARFWNDQWVSGSGPLADYAVISLSDEEVQATIHSYVTESRRWDWEQIAPLLNNSSLLHIASVVAPTPGTISKRWVDISWIRSPEDFFELNTYDSSRGNPEAAGAGGLFRDVDVRWIVGFAQNIGIAMVSMAELLGGTHGDGVGLEHGMSKVNP